MTTIYELAALRARQRNKLPDSAFALPGRRYSIHDLAHARNALSRVAANGTPEEQKKVRAAVARRYGKRIKSMRARGNPKELASSSAYPDLERVPGKQNWVDKAGGLPSYIERIAKHLHYEQGYSISRAIATAVNTVKRWAAGGTVTEHGTSKRVSPQTQAQAAKAVAEWEAKKAKS
jgi:hypothetical protein